MRHKGPQVRTRLTVNGRVVVRRVRWHDASGARAPADRWLDTRESPISQGVREMACRLNASSTSYEAAAANLDRCAHVRMSKETLRTLVIDEGKQVQRLQASGALQPETTTGQGENPDTPSRLYAGCDGVKVPLVTDEEKKRRRRKVRQKRQRAGKRCKPLSPRRKGSDQAWKEFRVVTIYDETQTRREVRCTRGNHEAAGRLLRRMATETGFSRADERIAVVDGRERIRDKAATYTAKYRDGQGIVREKATGCKDRAAALAVLADLESRAEKVRGGILTADEAATSEHVAAPIETHTKAYLRKLEADGTTPAHRQNVERCLRRIVEACRFRRLADLRREAFEAYLVEKAREKVSARTRNLDRASLVAFCNWAVETKRLTSNPFIGIKQANERADRRKVRRALTEAALRRLIFVCRWRPLAELGRATDTNDGKACGWTKTPLSFDTMTEAVERARVALADNQPFLAEKDRLGRERALLYKTFILTGLRRNELKTLTVGRLSLHTEPAYLPLGAENEKNRRGNSIPLRSDLADDLRAWITSEGLRSDDLLFRVPETFFESWTATWRRLAFRKPTNGGELQTSTHFATRARRGWPGRESPPL